MNLIKRAIVSVSSTALTDEEKYLLNKHNPLGVTLFLRNIETPHQLQSLVKELRFCELQGMAGEKTSKKISFFKCPVFNFWKIKTQR